MRVVGFILAYLSFEESKFSEYCLTALERAINEKPSSDFRTYFVSYKKILCLNDSLQD